jgi:hypothetical protein
MNPEPVNVYELSHGLCLFTLQKALKHDSAQNASDARR